MVYHKGMLGLCFSGIAITLLGLLVTIVGGIYWTISLKKHYKSPYRLFKASYVYVRLFLLYLILLWIVLLYQKNSYSCSAEEGLEIGLSVIYLFVIAPTYITYVHSKVETVSKRKERIYCLSANILLALSSSAVLGLILFEAIN